MRKILLFAAVFTVLIASCKKEESGSKPQNFLDKVNPLYFNEGALVEHVDNQYVSPSNVTRISYVASNPVNSFTANVAYEFRADGRPTKSTISVGGFSSVSTYSYK
jgi:hypothetical protein